MTIRLLTGDCRDVLASLPACSVHTVVTSPPYYGLRDYGTAQWEGGDAACDHMRASTKVGDATTLRMDGREHIGLYDAEKAAVPGYPYRDTCGKCGARRIDRQLGLEATPEAYLAAMVEVFRAVRRVLRDDGTCWVNIGDSYSGGGTGGAPSSKSTLSRHGADGRSPYLDALGQSQPRNAAGAKPKDLLLMPARLALALQADGWWIRSDIIWHKPNPMPESCTDRPTSAHEHVFLLSKRARYYYDADAVREEGVGAHSHGCNATAIPGRNDQGVDLQRVWGSSGRNLRNVWTLPTESFSGSHFATFPTALVERCIRAGTSERGACSACGAPWVRVTERGDLVPTRTSYTKQALRLIDNPDPNDQGRNRAIDGHRPNMAYETTTTGWAPSCQCNEAVVPCTVLDPFVGSGTTALVADRLQRHAIGIDLSIDYAAMAQRRLEDDCPLFTAWAPAETDAQDERMRDLFSVAAD